MTWVIAILLGLILVAMVSSNQAAAAGVWTVVRFVGWGVTSLLGWGLLIGYSVWFYETYPSSGEWTRIIGVAFAVILPPILLWLSRKEIAAAYKKDKWESIKSGALLAAYVLLLMVIGVVVREVQAAYEYGGWAMVLIPLAITSAILAWRSCVSSLPWREIWFGPPELPDPGFVVMLERDAAETAQAEAWNDIETTWEILTEAQKASFTQARQLQRAATEERLTALSKKLEAEKTARTKANSWTVLGFFWLFLVFAAIGLTGILWDIGFAYAMELKFVKGQVWLAGAVVVFAAMVLGGLGIGLWESIAEGNAKKS
jgi:hypothetical protein